MNAEGLNKAALLLMSIGEEEAAEVFKYLAPREVQKIGATMAALKNVTRENMLALSPVALPRSWPGRPQPLTLPQRLRIGGVIGRNELQW